MKRLFFALWPDETVRQRCARMAKSISRPDDKPVRPDNLHMTLVFLGNIDAMTETLFIQAASVIAAPVMTITFDRVSYWRKPRVVCLTGRSGDTGLDSLVSELTAISRTLGIPVDDRPFTPHITLIRKARALKTIEFEPIVWQADAFCLVESCSGPDGVEYRVIRQWDKPSGRH